ncbi:hypothetical protein MPH_05396 [Macrophomina phaseolina MS6]|uniref:Clr5 domain-containing protein n=1 Tax=Macrophomina phaseolina (strain MS6) TaxID=1126212 RepID=K2SKK3_MACPH|nr:hypothetical protein MPH_05396 [Macrophomina phaseolina MS6]
MASSSKIPVLDWEGMRDNITRLHLQEAKPLGEVISCMEDTYGFHATKSQYEGQFRKWNIRKNLRKGHAEQHWKLIKWKIEKRRKQGKETDVYMDGALLQSKKVKKEISRYSISTMEGLVFHNKCPATPPSFNLRTPVLIPASDTLVKTDINIRASGPQISILPGLLRSFAPLLSLVESMKNIQRRMVLGADSGEKPAFLNLFQHRADFPINEDIDSKLSELLPFTESSNLVQNDPTSAAALLKQTMGLVSNRHASANLMDHLVSWFSHPRN